MMPSIEILLADLDAAGPSLGRIDERYGLVPAVERARFGNMASEVAAERRAAQVALRIVLCRAVGLERARHPFRLASRGKPSLSPGGSGVPDLEFSLAHSAAWALIAVSRVGPVGVDLEASRRVRVAAARRRAILEAARAVAGGTPLPVGPDKDDELLQAWTRLEALAKATGTGLWPLLDALGVAGRRGASKDTAEAVRLRAEAGRFRVSDLALGCGLHGAIARHGGDIAFSIERLPVAEVELVALAALGPSPEQ